MLGYRRKHFDLAHSLLRGIVQSPENVFNVVRCQQLLLQEILHAEAHIFRHKSQSRATRSTLNTTRPTRHQAKRLKRKLDWIEARIEAYRQLMYIWRCFGDGIAFVYLDKFAIKHAYFETATDAVKQSAGFLSGKSGLANEIILVEAAASHGIPSVLTDLTNSIGHGDVCLLGNSDPYLIEVKSSERLNRRGKRQISDIGKLHSFYKTDVATNFHGEPEVRRVAASAPDRCYLDEMNSCIDGAERRGLCVVNPEAGLYYAAIYRGTVGAAFDAMQVEAPSVFPLNAFKSNRAWSPYCPFTLSIEKQHHLYDFIRGDLFLLVVLDRMVIRRQLAAKGYELTSCEAADYPLTYRNSGAKDGFQDIARQMLQRIGLEFLSPKWVLDSSTEAFERARASAADEQPNNCAKWR